MKTIRAHLNDLHEPERSRALCAMVEDSANDQHPILADALYCAFAWCENQIESGYWIEIHDKLEDGTYFDAPQLTPEVLKDKMVKRMATPQDMAELEELIRNVAPPTTPNFGTIFPDADEERQKYPLAQTDLFFPDADAAFSKFCLVNQQKHFPDAKVVTWAKNKSIGDGSQLRRHLMEFLRAVEDGDFVKADREIKSVDWRGRELHQRWIKKMPPFDNL